MSEEPERRCVFIPDRGCHVDADEIPLEICQLCLETWKAMNSRPVIRRAHDRLRKFEAQSIETVEEQPERVDMTEALSELDRMFEEEEIGPEEYVRRRKSIIDSARQKRNSLFAGLEKILGRSESGILGLLLVEKRMLGVKVKATAPEGWRPPESLESLSLEAVYNFYASLKEQAGDIRLEHRDFKVSSLGFRDGKLALLISDSRGEPRNLEEHVRKFSSRLKRETNWEKNLGKIHRELLEKAPQLTSF